MLYQESNSYLPYNYIPVFYEDFGFVEHLHGDPELIYVFDGEIVLTVEGEEVALGAGDFALVLPNRIHAYRTERTSRVWVGVFSGDYVRDFAAEMKGLRAERTRFRCDPVAEEFVRKYMIFSEAPTREELTACLSILCAQFRRGNTFTERKTMEGDRLQQILGYLSEHFTEEVSLASLARELHLDKNYLSRCFHRSISVNFADFVNRYRVSLAQYLLTQPLSMTEIAEKCGFGSVRSFNRAFLRVAGRTPGECRKGRK